MGRSAPVCLLAALLAGATGGAARAQAPEAPTTRLSPPEAPTTRLSPELRAAFVAEMQHLDKSLQAAVSALARADWPAVERAAHDIAGSFILAQRLGPEQSAELHRVLPEAFLAQDREFHARAERLAAAAKRGDGELAAFYTYKLTDSCVSCHATYARHRFPGLAPAPEAHPH